MRRSVSGTPQGGVISPLLCNVYLNRLDRGWRTRGEGVLCRYADDLVVMCKTKREAEWALGTLRAILAARTSARSSCSSRCPARRSRRSWTACSGRRRAAPGCSSRSRPCSTRAAAGARRPTGSASTGTRCATGRRRWQAVRPPSRRPGAADGALARRQGPPGTRGARGGRRPRARARVARERPGRESTRRGRAPCGARRPSTPPRRARLRSLRAGAASTLRT